MFDRDAIGLPAYLHSGINHSSRRYLFQNMSQVRRFLCICNWFQNPWLSLGRNTLRKIEMILFNIDLSLVLSWKLLKRMYWNAVIFLSVWWIFLLSMVLYRINFFFSEMNNSTLYLWLNTIFPEPELWSPS